MDLTLRTETFGQEDQSWLGSAHGTSSARTITLDISAFTEGTHYPDGYLPSGLPLGKITSSGLYGPYGGNANEVQHVTVDATSGNYTLTFDGETTGNIAATAVASAVQTALEALSNINAGDVTVTGGPGDSGGTTPYVVTFGGQYAGEAVPDMTGTDVSLAGGAGTVVVSEETEGGSSASDGTETFVGHLFTTISTNGTNDPVGALFEHGRVVEANLPVAIDASAKADVAGQIVYV